LRIWLDRWEYVLGKLETQCENGIRNSRFLLNEAMDKVRKAERIEHDKLNRVQVHVSEKQEKALSEMIELYPTLGTDYRTESAVQ